MSDDWKASVDRQLGQLHDDVQNSLCAGVVAAIALAALIGGLYLHTDGKFADIDQRMDRIEVQVQRIDGKIDIIGAKIDALRDRTTSTR